MQNKRRALRLVIFWVLAIGWIAVLFFFSGQTAAESSALSGSLADLVRGIFPFNRIPPDQLEHVLRKLAHFGFFGLEGLLLGLAAMQSVRRLRAGALLSTLACGILAGANELHQRFFEGRSCEVGDMLIDFGGALLGVAAAALLLWIIRRRKG